MQLCRFIFLIFPPFQFYYYFFKVPNSFAVLFLTEISQQTKKRFDNPLMAFLIILVRQVQHLYLHELWLKRFSFKLRYLFYFQLFSWLVALLFRVSRPLLMIQCPTNVKSYLFNHKLFCLIFPLLFLYFPFFTFLFKIVFHLNLKLIVWLLRQLLRLENNTRTFFFLTYLYYCVLWNCVLGSFILFLPPIYNALPLETEDFLYQRPFWFFFLHV